MKEKIRKEYYRRARAILLSRSNQHTSNTCSPLQFQCYQLELRRNKMNGQKDTEADDLEQDESPKSRY